KWVPAFAGTAALSLPSSPKIDPEHQLGGAARFGAAADGDSAILEDDPARGLVVVVAGDLDAPQPDLAGNRQHQRQRAGRIAAPPLPRHHRIADMAGDMIGQPISTRDEAQGDDPAELAV